MHNFLGFQNHTENIWNVIYFSRIDKSANVSHLIFLAQKFLQASETESFFPFHVELQFL